MEHVGNTANSSEKPTKKGGLTSLAIREASMSCMLLFKSLKGCEDTGAGAIAEVLLAMVRVGGLWAVG